jgi:AcrR family transcriptional regulator
MTASRATPGQPRKRGRRPKTEAAVLAATTELLTSAALSELTVAQILSAAAVGRTSFYEHFSSKDDVVAKLMRSISAEVGEAIEPMFERGEQTPDEAFAEGLTNLLTISARYTGLILAVTEEWPAVPELRKIWFSMMGDITERLAQTIERDRAAGIAPPGADGEALAAALTWSTERAFHVASTGEHPTLDDVSLLIEPLVQLYVGAIYGRPVRPGHRP